MNRFPRRAALIAALVPFLVLGAGAPAWAHDALIESTPAANSTVTEALTTISLTFSEQPAAFEDAAIDIEVFDPSGVKLTSGEVTISDRTLTKAVTPSVQGEYEVVYQNISSDSHVTTGDFTFTYAGPVAEATTAPATAPATSAPATTATTAPAEPEDGWNLGLTVGIVLGLIVVAGLGALVAVLVARARGSRSSR